jgi:hypothetical protein
MASFTSSSLPDRIVEYHGCLFRQLQKCRIDFAGSERDDQPADRYHDRAAGRTESIHRGRSGYSDSDGCPGACRHSGGNGQLNGSTLLGTANLNASGVATFTLSSLPSGTETIAAVYSGNAGLATSTSVGLEVTVTSASTFGVTAPASPFTVNAGGSVEINITVPPIGGPFDSLVTMSASGLPAGATAAFNPAGVTPGSSGAATVLRIQTAAHTAALPAGQWQFPFLPVSLAAGFCVMAGPRKRMAKSGRMLLLMAMLAGVTLLLTGCNGGFAGSSQSFPITVTGTSGTQHVSTTFTLIVK